MSSHPKVRVVKIEDGKGRPLGRSFQVKLWPTLVLMNDGKVVQQLVRPDLKQAREALEALAAAAPGWLAPLIDSGWADRYGARIDSYRFPEGDDARRQWAGQVGRDGRGCAGGRVTTSVGRAAAGLSL